MSKEKMQSTVDKFEKKHLFSKYRIIMLAECEIERIHSNNEILECIPENERNSFIVHGTLDDIAIVKDNQERYADYPYSFCIKMTDDDMFSVGWTHTSHMHKTAEQAMLAAIGCKHEGINSRFGEYAARMVGAD